MVSRRTRVVSWIFRRDHPSRPKAMICCFFSSFKTFAMSREATDPPAAVNVLDVSSESMAAFQVFLYGRFWVFTEGQAPGAEFCKKTKLPGFSQPCEPLANGRGAPWSEPLSWQSACERLIRGYALFFEAVETEIDGMRRRDLRAEVPYV